MYREGLGGWEMAPKRWIRMGSQIAGAAAIYIPMACSAWVFLLLADMDIRSDWRYRIYGYGIQTTLRTYLDDRVLR